MFGMFIFSINATILQLSLGKVATFLLSQSVRGSGALGMMSAGARAYNGGLGALPQRGPGAEPLIRGPGKQSPHEAENLLASGCATEAANLPHSVRTLSK